MTPLPTASPSRPTAIPGRGARRLLAAGTLVVGLAACSGSSTATSTPDPTAAATATEDPTVTTAPPTTAPPTSAPPTSDTPSSAPATPAPTPSDAPTSDAPTSDAPTTPDGDPEETLPACDDERRDELETLVGAQLDAFATGDFAGAHELTSTTFRAGIDVDDFQALIREQYPVVLDDTDPAYGRCVSTAAQGVLEVGLSGPDGVASLVWLLVRENGRWAIDGAQYTTPPADDDTIET